MQTGNAVRDKLADARTNGGDSAQGRLDSDSDQEKKSRQLKDHSRHL